MPQSDTLNEVIAFVLETQWDKIYKMSSKNFAGVVTDTALMVKDLLSVSEHSYEDGEYFAANTEEALIDAMREDGFDTCELSGLLLHEDHLITIQSNQGSAVVSELLPSYTCDDCGEHFLDPSGTVPAILGSVISRQVFYRYVTNVYDVGSELICEECFSDHYGTCDECGTNLHRDNLQYSEENCADYCEGCFPNGIGEIENRLRLPLAALSSTDRLAVGWEIECYPSSNATEPSHLHVERIYKDGSLGENGRELTTQPALPHEWHERLCGLSPFLTGAEVETDCGGHLHVDARYLHSVLWVSRADGRLYPVIELSTIHPLFVYYQNCLRLLCTPERNTSSYCRPQVIAGYSWDKYCAVNITGLEAHAGRRTIEFRLWEGSINKEDLYHRAEVCEAIVRKITEVAELSRQNASTLIAEKNATDLVSIRGFEDLYENTEDSIATIEALAKELQLSPEWITWAKKTIVAARNE